MDSGTRISRRRARFQPLADQSQQPPVRDTVFEETDEPFPVHRVEKRLDVRIQNPIHLLPVDRGRERIQRIMLAALRPESIGYGPPGLDSPRRPASGYPGSLAGGL